METKKEARNVNVNDVVSLYLLESKTFAHKFATIRNTDNKDQKV